MSKNLVSEKRPTWDEFLIQLSRLASKRSTCLRRKVGAVLVTKEYRIISVGWNGSPSGSPHCEEIGGCLREELKIPSGQRHEICRAVHAEQNTILVSAMYGASTKDGILFSNNFPCVICSKMIVQAGIKEVVYSDEYGDAESYREARIILKQGGVKIRKVDL